MLFIHLKRQSYLSHGCYYFWGKISNLYKNHMLILHILIRNYQKTIQLNEYVLILFGIFVISNDDCWVICMLLSNVKSIWSCDDKIRYRPLSCLPTFRMRAQLGFRKPGKDSYYNGKRTTRIIQIVRFKRPKSQRRTALEREKAIPHWSVGSEFWFGSRKSWTCLWVSASPDRPHSLGGRFVTHNFFLN